MSKYYVIWYKENKFSIGKKSDSVNFREVENDIHMENLLLKHFGNIKNIEEAYQSGRLKIIKGDSQILRWKEVIKIGNMVLFTSDQKKVYLKENKVTSMAPDIFKQLKKVNKELNEVLDKAYAYKDTSWYMVANSAYHQTVNLIEKVGDE